MPSLRYSNSDAQWVPAQRLNLKEIRRSLKRTQLNFTRLNKSLEVRRAPLTDEVIDNLMEGYGFVDEALVAGVGLLARGHSELILELNSLVLLGSSQAQRDAFDSHIEYSRQHFYEMTDGGIGSLMEWQDHHTGDSLWHRAAGLYIQILSQPQLFMEGNHRTAILLVSFLLVKEGYPPFVLSPGNARALLNHSKKIENLRKHSLGMLLHFSGYRNRLADTLRGNLDQRHLSPVSGVR